MTDYEWGFQVETNVGGGWRESFAGPMDYASAIKGFNNWEEQALKRPDLVRNPRLFRRMIAPWEAIVNDL